jgi:hypothetical protein
VAFGDLSDDPSTCPIANNVIFFARCGEMLSNPREDHEIGMLALNLLQSSIRSPHSGSGSSGFRNEIEVSGYLEPEGFLAEACPLWCDTVVYYVLGRPDHFGDRQVTVQKHNLVVRHSIQALGLGPPREAP